MRILNVRQVYFLNIFAIFLLLTVTVMQIVSQQFNKQFTLKRPGLKNCQLWGQLPASCCWPQLLHVPWLPHIVGDRCSHGRVLASSWKGQNCDDLDKRVSQSMIKFPTRDLNDWAHFLPLLEYHAIDFRSLSPISTSTATQNRYGWHLLPETSTRKY